MKCSPTQSNSSESIVYHNHDTNRLIRLKEVLQLIPVRKSTWWAWCKQGKAPAPIRLGRCTFWRYADVVAMFRGEV